MNSRHKWPALLLGLSLAISACGQPGGGPGGANGEEDEEDTPAVPVEVSSGTRSDIYASFTGTAAVEAFQDATVIAKVGGEVRQILVEEGQDVKAGQLLARLDGDRLRFEQKQTEANLRKLQRDYQRNIDLKDRGLISEGDFEEILYNMEALEAANNLAKLQLSYSDIRAPIDGVISERFIKVGNTLDIDAQAFQVTSLEPLISYLHVPEREYRKIRAGQTASMVVDALGGDTFQGTVARISPVVDPATGTFKITIEVVDESRRLKPGMFARIGIVHDVHENALQIPRSALVAEVDGLTVFVIEDDVAHQRFVQTGFSSEGRVEITDGLTDDDKFVVIGMSGLKDGSKVDIIRDDSEQAAAAQNVVDE